MAHCYQVLALGSYSGSHKISFTDRLPTTLSAPQGPYELAPQKSDQLNRFPFKGNEPTQPGDHPSENQEQKKRRICQAPRRQTQSLGPGACSCASSWPTWRARCVSKGEPKLAGFQVISLQTTVKGVLSKTKRVGFPVVSLAKQL